MREEKRKKCGAAGRAACVCCVLRCYAPETRQNRALPQASRADGCASLYYISISLVTAVVLQLCCSVLTARVGACALLECLRVLSTQAKKLLFLGGLRSPCDGFSCNSLSLLKRTSESRVLTGGPSAAALMRAR